MVADEVSRSNGLQVERASAARVTQSKQHGRAGSSAPYRAACATSPFAAVAGGMEYAYKLLFCIFVIIGAAASLGSVIGFSDAMIFAMMVPNMVGLVLLAPKGKDELNKYISAIKDKKA